MKDRMPRVVVLIALLYGAICVASLVPYFTRSAEASETPVAAALTGLNAQTASADTHTPWGAGYMPRCRESAVYIAWGANVTSGAVAVETSYDGAYTGTWANLATVTFSATAPKQDIVQITGIHGALRTRISTVVGGGGTVSSYLVCN